jgi:hypothetical protein
MDPPDENAIAAALAQLRLRVIRYVLVLITFLLKSVPNSPRRAQQIPFHTSILTGQAWVDKLLMGHPNRILFSLGMRKDVFLKLVSIMRSQGLEDSRWVTLEEQLAIFLHASVTGLTIRHLAERFQRSNATISQ